MEHNGIFGYYSKLVLFFGDIRIGRGLAFQIVEDGMIGPLLHTSTHSFHKQSYILYSYWVVCVFLQHMP